MSAKTTVGVSAAVVLVAFSSACTVPWTTTKAPVFNDSQIVEHVVGEPVEVETINSRANYVLWYPHVIDDLYTVKLEINCIACTRWMPGELVLVKDDGSRVKSVESTIDLADYLAPFEVRRGDVSFKIDDPTTIDRIVLMRGEPIAPAAKWKVEDDVALPTLEPEPPVKLVALGDGCAKSGPSTAQTSDGKKAYCSRLDYTTTYLWAARKGVIPNEPVQEVEQAPVRAAAPVQPKPAPKPPPVFVPPPPPPLIFVPPPLPPWLR